MHFIGKYKLPDIDIVKLYTIYYLNIHVLDSLANTGVVVAALPHHVECLKV